jgi:SAM-dependent methyltransferase
MSFGIDIVECLGCGFVQSEYVSESALRDYYSKFYRPPLSGEEIRILRRKSYDQAVSQIEYINSIISGKKFTNSLDYGAADGELAKLLKGISQAVYVTEFDPQYVKLLKKEEKLILLDESDLDTSIFSNFFGFISISHVLEHLTDPILSLERFSRLLKKDGFLLVDLPNEVELLTKANFQAKGHLSYFTVDSFKRLVNTHGKFDILEIRTCNRSVEEFIVSGFRLPEQYFRQNTPNGTVIRALLLNARPDAVLDRRPKDFIDDRLLLDDYSRRILHMHKSFMALQAQKDEIERRCEITIEAHGKLLKRLNQCTSEQIDLSNKAAPGKLDQGQIDKFEHFLERVKKDTYPEYPTELHSSITKKMFDYFSSKYPLSIDSRILDIGCGQGVALELFTKKGFAPIGITLNSEDVSICQQRGYEVYEMDQSFLNFPDKEFDFVWCRHCLEHSIFPYFTLLELFRVLKPKGYLYIEVPAPDTSCKHQTNKNHYSVLGKSMWSELIKRTGFNILEVVDISFMVHAGPDAYWAFIQQKP